MRASLTLRRPANWQDFETLCKKLWGEIWNCPEIQKNGRLGQDQSGVDIFGIPLGDNAYYGIQCKGKSEYKDYNYTHQQFTEEEFNTEIEKAKEFKPSLKKLYFATTALNDNKAQAFIRQKNIEHKTKNLFEVHLFCWETIVDLIDENKHTHDWFVKSQNYKIQQNVAITFQNNDVELNCIPKFKKVYLLYTDEDTLDQSGSIYDSLRKQRRLLKSFRHTSSFLTKVNLSYFKINLQIKNSGISPIEEYKLFFNFEGDILDLKETNEDSLIANIISPRYIKTTFLWLDSLSGKIVPIKGILVSDDVFISEDIFIKTDPVDSKILIKWKLISKDYKDEGTLQINVQPDIETLYEDVLVDDTSKTGIEEGEIEDYIVDKDE